LLNTQAKNSRDGKPIILWILGLCLLTLCTLVVGGVTRLTGSGLSIVNWDPIMGVIPPLHHDEWVAAFEQYQQFPQYRIINSAMTLGEFKMIFFWEYFHRILGRTIGMAFVVPYLFFVSRRMISRKMSIRMVVALVLGGMQGILGWYMVKSGLVDIPYVSHYRLAAHLSLALVILIYLFWNALSLMQFKVTSAPKYLKRFAIAMATIIAIQIVFGAFTAGLHAGVGYNTFPTMNGEWVPAKIGDLAPAWLNLFENTVTIQFIHRILGWIILLGSLVFGYRAACATLSPLQKRAALFFTGLVLVQFTVGVLTLIHVVPFPLAITHQMGATLLLLTVFFVIHVLGGNSES
jgi:cytochrome c oxidase assembly protein subunit 15